MEISVVNALKHRSTQMELMSQNSHHRSLKQGKPLNQRQCSDLEFIS